MNYYNEFDPYAAQWLRNLIEAGHIPQGEVDSRSIKDVRASDLTGFVQCHFFAGLGGWSHALRLARWPEDRPVWTGSCPCQPFSAAGAQKGTADDRHLWPVWFNLIRECRPGVVFGEQVESAINHGWLDLVQANLEGEGYACGAVGLPAGGVGAPHIRQRLWFVADRVGVTARNRSEMRGELHGELRGERFAEGRKPSKLADAQHDGGGSDQQGWQAQGRTVDGWVNNGVDQLADTNNSHQFGNRSGGRKGNKSENQRGWSNEQVDGCLSSSQLADATSKRGDKRFELESNRWEGETKQNGLGGKFSQLADAEHTERGAERQINTNAHGRDGLGRGGDVDQLGDSDDTRSQGRGVSSANNGGGGSSEQSSWTASATNGFWSDCDWLPCRDGKARPVEPGTFPLAHGVSARVGRLRAYGNAIVPQAAQVFIEAYLET